MSINIGPAETEDLSPRITVIGVGGAGGNAIANMIAAEIEGVDFIVANTDAQALSTSPAEKRIQLGPDITGGLGAGSRPEVGKASAEETVAEIEESLDGVNMVFIAAGMGGGTGTGAAPVIAEAARRKGVLTVGVVTKPFLFEGTRRMRAAEAGIAELQEQVDTLIVIPNQNLFLVAKPETTFKEAFELADEVLQQGVRSITDLMVMPGLINLDFADVRSVMSEMGKAMMGTGESDGENRALNAAEQAIANPLLDGVSMQGAKGVIISIIGGEDMKLMEVDEAANHIRDLVDEDANIIWGSAFNQDLSGKVRVSVVATGIEQTAGAEVPRASNSAFSTSRAPKRPVLELSEESAGGDADIGDENAAEQPTPSPTAPRIPVIADPVADAMNAPDDEEDSDFEAYTEHSSGSAADETDGRSEPFDLTGMQAGDDMGEDHDDVDGIVDPLAGLRGAEDDSEYGAGNEQSSSPVPPQDDTLDLNAEYTEEAGSDISQQDDLLADADRLAADNKPVGTSRRQGILGSGSGDTGNPADNEGKASASSSGGGGGSSAGGGGAPSGTTLFERMANLSRSSGPEKGDDEDEDEDSGDSPALSIPRFLGRQNNQ